MASRPSASIPAARSQGAAGATPCRLATPEGSAPAEPERSKAKAYRARFAREKGRTPETAGASMRAGRGLNNCGPTVSAGRVNVVQDDFFKESEDEREKRT